MTRDDLENDEVFSAAVNGLPKVVELITAAPEEKRSLALAAAHQAYLRTAQELGYDESDAQQWASAVMSLIVTSNELILSRVAADLLGRPSVLPERFNAPADCASLIHATRLYPALTFGASATAPAASQSWQRFFAPHLARGHRLQTYLREFVYRYNLRHPLCLMFDCLLAALPKVWVG
jgi:hypothetical protein